MLEPKKIDIDGFEFTLHAIKGRKAMWLSAKLATLLAPVLAPILTNGLDHELNFSELGTALTSSLQSLNEAEYTKLIEDLLATTTVIVHGEPVQYLTGDVIDRVFVQKTITLYKVIWEVVNYNKFLPLELGGKGGNEITETDSSKNTLAPTKTSTEN